MAGGTGGHIYPALAVAKRLQAEDIRTVWLGSKQGLENRIIPKHGIKLIRILVSGLRGTGARRWLAAPFLLSFALFQSLRAIWDERPSVVLGMGGFASGPGGLAAWINRTPLIIHEQNARAGSTNKILSRFATQVFQAFPGTFQNVDAITVGNPLRAEIAALSHAPRREQDPQYLNVLILGGSRGARFLNAHVPGALLAFESTLDTKQLRVRHQCGDAEINDLRAHYLPLGERVEVTAFIEDMAEAYEWADLVICRAGAMTVSELAIAGRASILVPFPYATDDHQTLNARFLADQGAAVVLPQEDDFEQRLGAMLVELLEDRQTLTEMARKARDLATADAAEKVAARCRELVYG